MDGLVVVFLVILGILAAAGVGYLLWQRELARRDVWASWAADRDWVYDHTKNYGIAEYFGFVNKLNRGDDRYGEDVLRGNWHGREAVAFTYHHETESTDSDGNRETKDNWMWVTAIQLEQTFPELRISPEHMGKRFLHAFTGSDIDFESVEFSRSYEVKSRDKKFAYDFCNSAMIDFLMLNQGSVIELEGPWLVSFGDRKLKLEMVEPALDFLTHIRSLMPQYLFRPNEPSISTGTERQQ